MTQKVIKLPEDNASKSAEIDALHGLVDAAQANPRSYLASLFTPEFFIWAEAQIKNDTSPDIMDALKFANHTRDEEAKGYQEKINKLEQQIKGMEGAIDKQLGYLAEKDHQIEMVNEANAKAHIATHEAQERLNFAHDQFSAAQRQLAARDQTILELKAKIYDLQDAKNGNAQA
jgi:chromosome segregation ATPase